MLEITRLLAAMVLMGLPGAGAAEPGYGFSFGGRPVYQVSADGSEVAVPEAGSDDDSVWLRRSLAAPPELDSRLAGPKIPAALAAHTIRELLDSAEVAQGSYDPRTLRFVGEVGYGKPCLESRQQLGKLLLCLDRLQRGVTQMLPTLKEAARRGGRIEKAKAAGLSRLGTAVALARVSLLYHAGLLDGAGRLVPAMRPLPDFGSEDGVDIDGWRVPQARPEQESYGALASCAWGLGAATRGLGMDVSGCRGRTDLGAFDPRLEKISLFPTVEGCLDLVRMAGVTRIIEAHRKLVGGQPEIPKSCEPLRRDIDRLTSKPLDPKDSLVNSPAYQHELRAAARALKPTLDDVLALEHFAALGTCFEGRPVVDPGITFTGSRNVSDGMVADSRPRIIDLCLADTEKSCVGDAACLREGGNRCRSILIPLNIETRRNLYRPGELTHYALLLARDQLAKAQGHQITENMTRGIGCVRHKEGLILGRLFKPLERKLQRQLMRYPLLALGHDPSKHFDAAPPKFIDRIASARNDAELGAAVAEAAAEAARALDKSMDKLCQFTTGAWRSLAPLEDLQAEAARHAPQCGPVYGCVKDTKERFEANSRILDNTRDAGCFIASLTPLAPGAFPLCAAASLFEANHEKNESKEALDWSMSCRIANLEEGRDTRICDDENYEEAATAYNRAVAGLYVEAAFTGLDSIGFFKEAGHLLKAGPLKAFAARLSAASAKKDAQAVDALAREAAKVADAEAELGAVAVGGGVAALEHGGAGKAITHLELEAEEESLLRKTAEGAYEEGRKRGVSALAKGGVQGGSKDAAEQEQRTQDTPESR